MSYHSESADEPRSYSRPPRLQSSGFSVIGLIALLVALATAGYVLYRDPPWGRLAKYNFSNPENALRSEFKMRANGDILSIIELENKTRNNDDKRRLDTLTINKTVEWKGKHAVFISFKDPGYGPKREEKEVKRVIWYEKDRGSGYFVQARDVDIDELRKNNKTLYDDIHKWTGTPEFVLPN